MSTRRKRGLMRLLVTGASGFIGKNFLLKAPSNLDIFGVFFRSEDFLDFLKENNLKNVTPVRCDLTDFQDVRRMSKKIGSNFDMILYLAGSVDPRKSVSDPLFDLDSNVRALVNFLENFSCGKFIFFSSGAVYDGLRGKVSPNSFILPTLPYAISKLAAENYIRFYHQRHKSLGKYIILRFFGAYGPHESSRKIYSKLVKTFTLDGEKEFTVSGNGKNYIDAMYIDDAIEGVIKVLSSKLEKSVTVDFGTGSPMTIDELVKEAASIFGINDVGIKHTGATAEYISFYISSKQMEKLFSFSPGIKLDEGLPKLAQHIKANPTTK